MNSAKCAILPVVRTTERTATSTLRSMLCTRDVPETGDVTDAEIIQTALGNVDDEEEDDEPPREIPTLVETRDLLRLLRNKVEYSSGEERPMRP
ncbi:hypothetical protein HPB47_011752 [Ixodes persulcatus]|uniref:Uncharacterized protein n=1 Tax=Ixodes persulcatus TaxID=34615 RepID=A0AC60NVF3_IXOPE|nr:hypothetical protein HPB47_011752 [Ixodes persulcatus]